MTQFLVSPVSYCIDEGGETYWAIQVPTLALRTWAKKAMAKAEALEKRILGFVRMDICDADPLIVDATTLPDTRHSLEARRLSELDFDSRGAFRFVDLDTTWEELSAKTDIRIMACNACVEANRIWWEFYEKHVPGVYNTGPLDRDIVSEWFKKPAAKSSVEKKSGVLEPKRLSYVTCVSHHGKVLKTQAESITGLWYCKKCAAKLPQPCRKEG